LDLIRDSDREYLGRLRDHPDAPQFNWTWTDQLSPQGLELVRLFADRLTEFPPRWGWGQAPHWVEEFVEACRTHVPFYRNRREKTMSRQDVREQPELLFPDQVDQSEMVYHETSGTTGSKVKIYNHPAAGECYLPLLGKALAEAGVHFSPGPHRVCLMLVFHHTTTLTYPQICPVLDGAAFLRLNLHPSHWKNPDSRTRFLNFCAPQIYTGTPLSLMELTKFPLEHKPRALVTTSMALLPATRKQLQDHFQCPLIDLYSMAECRCIAARHDDGDLDLLAHDVYVEILDPDGNLCPPGEVGEITLTGGRNPYLPLLRYRTGDFVSMVWDDPEVPRLRQIEGRAPVNFLTRDGERRNNMEVTRTLSTLPLTQFSLHQKARGELHFRYRGAEELQSEIQARLQELLNQPLTIERTEESLGPKWIAYSTELN